MKEKLILLQERTPINLVIANNHIINTIAYIPSLHNKSFKFNVIQNRTRI